MSLLGGLDIREFLSTHEEWHALVEGFCDGFLPILKGYKPSKELKEILEKEHHYYRLGVILGFVTAVWFWIGVWEAVT